MASLIRDAYSRRAAEYTELLGSMDAVHPSDRQLVTSWAESISGPAIDAGCGPGHWTRYLTELGVPARGIDQVPEFIAHARETHPGIPFQVGRLEALVEEDATVGGVLAWYSLIHHEPDVIQVPLREFARVLRPGSQLLLGFFEGPALESFDHAVVTAYRWPVEQLGEELQAAGFDIIETHRRSGIGYRPLGAILARRTVLTR